MAKPASKILGTSYSYERLSGCRQQSGDLQLVWFGAHTEYAARDKQDTSPGTLFVRQGDSCRAVRFPTTARLRRHRTVTSEPVDLQTFKQIWAAAKPGPIDPSFIERALY